MKLKKIAFLFFCMLGLISNSIFSYQQKRSLNDYVTLYENAKNTEDLIEAFTFFQNDKEYYLTTGFYPRVLYDLYFISDIQYRLGNLHDSEASVIEGLELLDNLSKDSVTNENREGFLNQLGILKRSQKKYKESFKYYSEALSLAKTRWDSAVSYNNISVIHIHKEEYSLAKNKLQKAVIFFKQFNDSLNVALSLNNLGFVQSKLNANAGLENLLIGLKIRQDKNDNKLYESYKYISEYYIDRKELDKAIFYAKKGYESAKKFNSLPYKKDALIKLIYLKQFEDYSLELIMVNEKIDSIRLNNENKYAEAKYSVSREQKKTLTEQNKRKEAELNEAEANAENLLFLSGIIIVILGSTFIFYYLKNRHKKDNLKTRFDTERQISKKLHDEVANSVFHTMSKQQNKSTIDIELIDDLEEIYLKTRDISKTSAALKITENFDEDLKDLVLSYKTDTVNIFTRNMSEMPWNTLSHLKKETVYRVLQELMINMTKHSNASMVTLQFQKERRKIAIQYTDNGVGTALKKSNGLQNMENRIKDIGGTVIFESETNKGFQVKMTV